MKDQASEMSPEKGRSIPILGRVAAGAPILAEEHIEGVILLDESYMGKQVDFALKVKGDSMQGAGILDGDYVFVRRQPSAEPGEIVVAILDDEATVKRYYPDGKRVRLEPENPAFRTIVVERSIPRFQIAGKVVGLTRQIR